MRRNICVPSTYLIIKSDDKIILLKRKNTGYADGYYSFVAGHVEKGESFTMCIIREAREEAGIEINEDDLNLVHIMYRKDKNNKENERIDFFYEINKWKGSIVNLEPEKCSELKWFSKSNLPKNTIPYIRKTLVNIENKLLFSEYGWKPEEI